MIRQHHRRLLSIAGVLLAASCSKTPVAPSGGGTPSAGSVTLSGTVFDRLPGSTGGFVNGAGVPAARIEVRYANNPSLASISTTTEANGTFRLPGVRAGEYFRLRATKDGYDFAEQFTQLSVDATIDLSIVPVRTTLTGRITESDPGDGMAVAGARLEILSGSSAGRVSATDGNGTYEFANMWGEFDVAVSSANHEPRTVHAALGASSRLDFQLAPKTLRTRTTLAGELCTIERLFAWQSCTAPLERTHPVRIDRPGAATVAVDYNYVGDYYLNYLTLQLRCNGSVVIEKQFRKQGNSLPTLLPDNVYGGPIQIAAQPCAYEVRVFNFVADTKGGSQTKYRIDVDYPR
jgi:hypothetical protein